MTIYHTATLEDYEDLIIKLEKQGFKWGSGRKPTEEFNYKEYTSETTITTYTDDDIIRYACVRLEMEFSPGELIIEYKADKKQKTDDFIKELTVKIYYNEITKKHYNSYEEAIDDCKKEMMRLYDKN